MNYFQLSESEARFMLFSFKKTLRDRQGLTPTMEQFYESGVRILRKKLERIDRAGDGYPEPPERDRYAKVRPTWGDIALGKEPRDQSTDPGTTGSD
jgi:hypothetical protein